VERRRLCLPTRQSDPLFSDGENGMEKTVQRQPLPFSAPETGGGIERIRV